MNESIISIVSSTVQTPLASHSTHINGAHTIILTRAFSAGGGQALERAQMHQDPSKNGVPSQIMMLVRALLCLHEEEMVYIFQILHF